jgi:hypothetical protein
VPFVRARARKTDEELAVFDRDVGLVTHTGRRSFADWYLGES